MPDGGDLVGDRKHRRPPSKVEVIRRRRRHTGHPRRGARENFRFLSLTTKRNGGPGLGLLHGHADVMTRIGGEIRAANRHFPPWSDVQF